MSDRAVLGVLAMLPLAKLFGGPLWSWMADRSGREDRVLQVLGVSAAAAGLMLASQSDAAVMVVAVCAFALARAGQFPLVDALTVRVLPDGPRGYGRVRVWGSVAYIGSVLVAGTLRDTWPRAPLWIATGLLALAALSTFTLPRLPRADVPARTRASLSTLLKQPELRPLYAIAALHGLTIATYDHLFALHVERLGMSSRVAATGTAIGVAAEVLVLALGPRLMVRFGPHALLVAGVASGIPRWLLTGAVTEPWLLVAVQALHGLGFGAFWLAGVHLVAERAPEGLEGSAQAMLPATTFGVGTLAAMGLASVLMSPLGTSGLFETLAGVSMVATVGAIVLSRRVPSS